MDDLWKKIIETVSPLKNRENFFVVEPTIRKTKFSDIDVSFLDIKSLKKIKTTRYFDNILELGNINRIDKNFFRKWNKDFQIDQILDLHGCKLHQAYEKVISFININYELGNRKLLIITGKGNEKYNTGIINKSFLNWLNNSELNNKILYIDYAPMSLGGKGAFFVILRKL